MLVLARKKQQAITLETENGRITLTLARMRGDTAWIGIDAPRSVRILRSELEVTSEHRG